MNRKFVIIAATAIASLSIAAGPAFADHSSVVNPSGCHETNLNGGVPNARSGKVASMSGWHNSASGHERAVAVGAHNEGGC